MTEKRNNAPIKVRAKSSDYTKRSAIASACNDGELPYTKENTSAASGIANKRSKSSSAGGRARQMIASSRSLDSDNNHHSSNPDRNCVVSDQVSFE